MKIFVVPSPFKRNEKQSSFNDRRLIKAVKPDNHSSKLGSASDVFPLLPPINTFQSRRHLQGGRKLVRIYLQVHIVPYCHPIWLKIYMPTQTCLWCIHFQLFISIGSRDVTELEDPSSWSKNFKKFYACNIF